MQVEDVVTEDRVGLSGKSRVRRPSRVRAEPGGASLSRVGTAAKGLLVVAAVLVAISASLHLRLWSTGYDTIATIGPLFLLQGVSGLVMAVLLAALRNIWVALPATALMGGTVVGFLLSVEVGLFGFSDTFAAEYATLLIAVELAAVVLLVAASALLLYDRLRPRGEQAVSEDGSAV